MDQGVSARQPASERKPHQGDPIIESQFSQQFIQPGGIVLTQPAEQNEVRAARDDIDRIDLKQLHPPDRIKHILFGSDGGWCSQQTLGGEVDQADF